MQSIEITGRNAAEATAAAAAKLGAAESDLSITVLEESKGLFGKSQVRVRAELKAAPEGKSAPEPKAAPKRAAAKRVAPDETPPEKAPADEPRSEEPPKPAKAPSRRLGAKAAAQAAQADSEAEPAAAEKPSRGRRAAAPAEASAPAEPPKRGRRESAAAAPEGVEDAERPGEAVATKEDGERFVSLIAGLMEKADLDVTAKAKEISGRYVTVELDGKDAAYLVGKTGEVLNATQYLVNIIAGRRFNNGVRATLDGNDFRRRREARLESMATDLANQVKARGEEAVLDALPAFERRVVHKVLSGIEGVTTYSEGEEPNRRVVIAPAE